jgi:predicted ester cyclase
MPIEENKAIAKRLYSTFTEAIRTRNMNLLDEVLAPNGIDHNPAPGQAPGIEGVKQTFAGFSIAFPDLEVTVEDQIAEGDKVVSRIKAQGTHKGEFMGIGPTGKRITATGIDIVRIGPDGKIVERWGVQDNLSLLQQIGAFPGPNR